MKEPTQYISKSTLVAKIDEELSYYKDLESRGLLSKEGDAAFRVVRILKSFIDTLEVKEVGLIIHTIITECCDWLAMNTNLSHDEIEGCRNLMLTVKEEQFKALKENINSPEEKCNAFYKDIVLIDMDGNRIKARMEQRGNV